MSILIERGFGAGGWINRSEQCFENPIDQSGGYAILLMPEQISFADSAGPP